LARGELHCIGATTLDEYRQYIEKDAALERRFQKVYGDEPSVEDTIASCAGCKSAMKCTTVCDITDPAIVALPPNAERPLHHRPLFARQSD
jgi:ATP-dependent Clp protease ATP-binding subunit ClpB